MFHDLVVYCPENTFVRGDRRSSLKKCEKILKISNLLNFNKIFLKKNEFFSKVTEIFWTISQEVIQHIEVRSMRFGYNAALDLLILSISIICSTEKRSFFLKISKNFEKVAKSNKGAGRSKIHPLKVVHCEYQGIK